MTVAGSSRCAPLTEIERMVPVTAAGEGGEERTGAGAGAVWAGAAVVWAKAAAGSPAKIVPTSNRVLVRLRPALLTEFTRSRPSIVAGHHHGTQPRLALFALPQRL